MCYRGVEVDHTTLSRWVQKYAPELEQRSGRPQVTPTNNSWRVDETYVKMKGGRQVLISGSGCEG